MKKLQSLALIGLLVLFFTGTALNAQTTAPAQKTATVKIKTSAECDMCKKSIEKEVGVMKGVKSAVLNLETRELTVEYNPKKTSPDKIRTAIAAIGYDADEVKANNRMQKQLPDCCKKPGADSTHKPH